MGKSSQIDAAISAAKEWINRLNRVITGVQNKYQLDRGCAAALGRSYYGKGPKQICNNQAASEFVRQPPPYWRASDHIKTLKLRYNCLPTKAVPNNPGQEKKCRADCNRGDSVSHILQKCLLGYSKRMERHNMVVRRIVQHATRKG